MSSIFLSGCTITTTTDTTSWGGTSSCLYGSTNSIVTGIQNYQIYGAITGSSVGLYSDTCEVIMFDGSCYNAIDDIFKSATNNFYMQVMINNTYVNISLDKISEIENSKNNLNTFKNNLLRNKKLKRIL